MELKPATVLIPAHAHTALRIHAITTGKSLSRMILEAIDAKFPSVRCLETQPRAYDPVPTIGSNK